MLASIARLALCLAVACGPPTADTGSAGSGGSSDLGTATLGVTSSTSAATEVDPATGTWTDASTSAATGQTSTLSTAGTADLDPPCSALDIVIETPAQLDALAGCTDLPGDLSIVGPITDLTPLASLAHVGGLLKLDGRSHVDSKLLSLAGLESLQSVGGLLIEGVWVTDLQPLAGLTDVPGGVSIVENEALTSLSGLHNLTHVGGYLMVGHCPQLTDLAGLQALVRVDGDFYLQVLPIVDLHGLEALAEIGTPGGAPVKVRLRELPQLASIEALNPLWHDAQEVTLGETALVDLGPLAGAVELRDLYLIDNPALASVDGLESLTLVHGQLSLLGNDALTDLGALAGLQSAGGLTLGGDKWLVDLSALTSLTTVGTLLVQNKQIKDLGPFPALQQVGTLWVRYTDQLESLSGLAGITTLEALRLDSNLSLVDLSGLSAITQIAGDVAILDNGALTSLLPLAALSAVEGDLTVVGNLALPQIDAEAWGAPIAVGMVRKIAGNKDAGPPKDPCPWSGDGQCDEPLEGLGICADKSDPDDCCRGFCE